MRAHWDIDEGLVNAAMEISGLTTEQEVIEQALSDFVKFRRAQRKALALEGNVEWEGDLDLMRRDR